MFIFTWNKICYMYRVSQEMMRFPKQNINVWLFFLQLFSFFYPIIIFLDTIYIWIKCWFMLDLCWLRLFIALLWMKLKLWHIIFPPLKIFLPLTFNLCRKTLIQFRHHTVKTSSYKIDIDINVNIHLKIHASPEWL